MPRDLGYGYGPRAMSWLRKRWLLARHPHVEITFSGPVYLGPGFSLHAPEAATLTIGRGVEFRRGFRCELAPGATLTIGDDTKFTYDVLIQCTTTIAIGKRCMFGQASAIFDGNHRFRDHTRPMLEQGYELRPIVIADDATVTTKCTIVADIGTHSFVGANAVVSRDLPAYVLAFGAPARPVDYYGPEGGEPPELATDRSDKSG